MASRHDEERAPPTNVPILDLRETWHSMPLEQRLEAFDDLDKGDADDFFLSLSSGDQAELIQAMPERDRRIWTRQLALDDLADVIQLMEPEARGGILSSLDRLTRREVEALLAYQEDEAGGLMNPRFARVRSDMRVHEALRYLRKQSEGGQLETMRYIYVLGSGQELLGVVSLRRLFMASGDEAVSEIMRTNLVTARSDLDQETLKNLFSQSALNAIPIVNGEGCMQGIVTIDDIIEVAEEEATEDIQKLGGSEVMDGPFLKIGIPQMIRKRAGWLVILFFGQMLTASAMHNYEDELQKALVIAIFIPLIISSGGNSGSQASTLVVRALALGEVRIRDWWRVLGRELISGLALGLILGLIGLMKIVFWPSSLASYGEHYQLIGLTVAASLMGVVLWGSLSGAMLPFALKRLGLDPATASAPFVATIVDVSGLIIYFSVASVVLRGTLL